MMNTTLETISSDKLIETLENAVSVYGNRPVFVEVNGAKYIINDMRLTVNGNNYTLILSNV